MKIYFFIFLCDLLLHIEQSLGPADPHHINVRKNAIIILAKDQDVDVTMDSRFRRPIRKTAWVSEFMLHTTAISFQ